MLGLIPFPKAIEKSINGYFDVLLDNTFIVEIQVGLRNHWMMRVMEYFKMRSDKKARSSLTLFDMGLFKPSVIGVGGGA